MKIHTYDTKKYDFKGILEEFFGIELEKLHEKIKFPKLVLPDSHDIWVKTYNFMESREFSEAWNRFSDDIMKKILDEESIVLQKLPSIKIFPSKRSIEFTPMKSPIHTDGQKPYYHPKFETNFWLPLTDVDEFNTMSIYNYDKRCLEPQLLKYGELLEFKGNTIPHGSKKYSKSNNTRVSFDFRGCKFSDYDESILKPIEIYSPNKSRLQNEWFTIGTYYGLR
jgi:hypothetical protein